jgi:hypothetical protein
MTYSAFTTILTFATYKAFIISLNKLSSRIKMRALFRLQFFTPRAFEKVNIIKPSEGSGIQQTPHALPFGEMNIKFMP